MQLVLISVIAIIIAVVIFALQNNTPVAVTLAVWRFEGSLALVLVLTLGLGALITGLLSSPAVIRRQLANARLQRQVADLEIKLAEEKRRNAGLARMNPPSIADASVPFPADPHAQMAGDKSTKPPLA